MNVDPTAAAGATGPAARPLPSQALGKDQFLQLLVLQLQNQDPLEPAKQDQFLSELAQFSALEQMNKVSSHSAFNAGVQLLGRKVTASDPQTGAPVRGVVTGVRVSSDQVLIRIGDQVEVPLELVGQVSQP